MVRECVDLWRAWRVERWEVRRREILAEFLLALEVRW